MKHFKEITKESNLYDILIDYIEFFMYSIPEEIYEEVRTILIERGLALIKKHRKGYLLPRMYRILLNIKISEMRKYYSKKHLYKQSSYEDGITAPVHTKYELNRMDTNSKYREQMEVLYTAIRRMRPTQKIIVRRFFKMHNKRKNFKDYNNFSVPVLQVIKEAGFSRRRGFKLLNEIRVLLKSVMIERRHKVHDCCAVRVETFDELWEGIKGEG